MSVLPLALLLAAAGVTAVGASVAGALGSVHRAPMTARLHLAGLAFTYPRLNTAGWILLALALIGTYAIGEALRLILRQRRAYRSLLARIELVGHLRNRTDVLVIEDAKPTAFCAGFLRPRVYVSRAALALLTDVELDAVLAHEDHHKAMRDPLLFACGRILSRALFFMPALSVLFGRYADVAELNADRAAARTSAGGGPALASALLAFDAVGAGIAPERVDSLLGNPRRWRHPWWLISASLGALSLLSALTLAASQVASARATLDLPLVSSQPCLVVLTVLSLLGSIAIRRTYLAAWRSMSKALAPRAAVTAR
jgi:hypothetical protein